MSLTNPQPALGTGALEHSAALVLVLDPDGRIVHWNEACSHLTGDSLTEIRGRDVRELLRISEGPEHGNAPCVQLRDTSIPARFETCFVTGSGERRWILWSNSAITDREGRVAYIVSGGVDITEHRRLEERLRLAQETLERKEGYLRAIFEHTFELMGLLAPDGTLLEANRRALEFVGATRDEIVGRPFWETPWWTHDAPAAERLRTLIAEAARGRFVRFETTHRGADGRMAVFDVSLTPVRDDRGEVVLIVPEGREITERKRAEQWQSFLAEAGAVLASTLDYEQTLRNVASLAVRSLADCCIVDLIDEGGEIRRLTVAHASAQRPWFADTLERIRQDQSRPYLARSVLETREPVLLRQVDAQHVETLVQDDEHRRALQALDIRSLMAVPLLARERVLGALTFLASTGGRQYGPDDLRLAQDLGHRAALAVENAKLYRAAQDAIQARDDVLGIVAHDLRNPLNAIQAAASMLQRSVVSEANHATRKAIDAILRASERANRLVRDLLEIRRITAGRLTLQRDRIDPRSLLTECVESHHHTTSAASLQMLIDAPNDLPEVWADRHRVLQVFENLIDNAIKFTPAGGRITLGAQAGDGEVIFRVSDTGAGIPGDLLVRLFDRFWQAQAADRRGIGLGLSIAKDVVDAHGGRIWAESQPGAGSTVFFSIPEVSATLQ